MNRKVLFSLIVIFCFALLAGKDLLLPGFWETHDGFAHVARLSQFDQAIKNGQFPVRWLPNLMAGYGSPVFNFNFSLPYYLGSAIHLVGLSYEGSIKAVLLLSLIFSGWAMYLLIKQLTNSELASITASILYIWSPYRFTDIYVRGALGECVSFIFFPLIIWCVIKANKFIVHSSQLLVAIIWALFILSHNIMALIGAGIYFGLIFILSVNWPGTSRSPVSPENSRSPVSFKLIKFGLISFALGLALSASFWLPALFEKKYDAMSAIKYIYSINDQFVPLVQILNSKWQYGLALPLNKNISMSFELGLVNIAVIILLGIFITLKYLDKVRPFQGRTFMRISIFTLILFIFSIFMCLPISKFIYNISFISGAINFPWRFLEIATLASSVTGGLVVQAVSGQLSAVRQKKNKIFGLNLKMTNKSHSRENGNLNFAWIGRFYRSAKRNSRMTSGVILSGLIIIFTIALNWNKAQIVSNRFSYSGDFYAKTYLTNNQTYFDTEYLPIWANYFGILENNGSASSPQDGLVRSSFFHSKTGIEVKDYKKDNLTYSAIIDSQKDIVVQAQQFYFPGWLAWIDSQEVKVNPDEFGLVSFSIPTGKHQVKVEFTDTLIRKIGNWVSLISFGGIIVYLFSFYFLDNFHENRK